MTPDKPCLSGCSKPGEIDYHSSGCPNAPAEIDFVAAALWADDRKGDPEERGNKYWDIWNIARAYDALYSKVGTCEWIEDGEGNWATGCAEIFAFNDSGPFENNQRFCGYCGKSLAPVAFEEDEDDE